MIFVGGVEKWSTYPTNWFFTPYESSNLFLKRVKKIFGIVLWDQKNGNSVFSSSWRSYCIYITFQKKNGLNSMRGLFQVLRKCKFSEEAALEIKFFHKFTKLKWISGLKSYNIETPKYLTRSFCKTTFRRLHKKRVKTNRFRKLWKFLGK